jgi:hypothetical protein
VLRFWAGNPAGIEDSDQMERFRAVAGLEQLIRIELPAME